jgi:hypothetical protein
MEGFARILWGLGPLWSGDNTALPAEVQVEIEEWLVLYRDGIVHGTTPDDEDYWGDIFDYDQKMVEVAALVFSIAINKDKLWYDLTDGERDNLYSWLNQMNDYDMPINNWRYFRILMNMMFHILGLPWSKERMEEDFELLESFYIGDGWYCDGEPTQIDYYVAFAIHYYGLVYAKLMEDTEPERCCMLKERSRIFYHDFIYWFANNGEEIPFGRSLTYRYAHCGLFGAMAYAELDVDYGVLKNLVLRNLETWMNRPIFDHTGVLTIGYGYPNPFMSENYNGCGSPYWCNKAFLILALNDDHSFWKAEPKDYPYEAKKYFKHPRMVITHDDNNHVMAYVTGQHLISDHGQGAAKYEKFVYSNQFGFSVSRGTTLAEGAFDNTLAISVKDENRYCMRYGFEKFMADEQSLYVKYSPITGVTVESTIVPCSSWHVRIHKITNEIAVDIADGGFSLPQERCFQLVSGSKSGRFEEKDIEQTDHSLVAAFPWGTSCVVSETGQAPELIRAFPNTNLLYNLTVIPTVKAALEPGNHLIVTSVGAEFYKDSKVLLQDKPMVAIDTHKVKITSNGETVVIITD